MSTSRIPNIIAIGESPRLMETLRTVALSSSPMADFVSMQPGEAYANASQLTMRAPQVALLEWKPGHESLFNVLRQADPHHPFPIWLMVRPGESPGLDGLHVSGSLVVHAEMESLEDQLYTLMDFLKICIYP